VDIGGKSAQPERCRLTEKMYRMSFKGKSLSQLCRHSTTPSVCMLARNTNFHLTWGKNSWPLQWPKAQNSKKTGLPATEEPHAQRTG